MLISWHAAAPLTAARPGPPASRAERRARDERLHLDLAGSHDQRCRWRHWKPRVRQFEQRFGHDDARVAVHVTQPLALWVELAHGLDVFADEERVDGFAARVAHRVQTLAVARA